MENMHLLEAAMIELKISQEKTFAELAEGKSQNTEIDTIFLELYRIMDKYGLNIGFSAKDFFYNSLKVKMKFGNIKFDKIILNQVGKMNGMEHEFDIVMYNGHTVALIEIKHKVHPIDIEVLKTKKLKNIKEYFSQYADYEYYLGIGGMSIADDIAQMARDEGIAVLRQVGELAKIDDKDLKKY
ncbi:MAG: hypothetical protein NW207_11840 [Cytophagales bacterium]|nr:hypothetical protein [Cytophagales bacterium]